MVTAHLPRHSLAKNLLKFALLALLPFAFLLHFFFFPFHGERAGRIQELVSPKAPEDAPPAQCDYADGEWVPDDGWPAYSGTSCGTIRDGQNCMGHGRPDTGYLRWRWRPRGCLLPAFDAGAFLDAVRDLNVAFVGDSMARNQLESLLCLLATAEPPELVYSSGEEMKFRRWVFRRSNTTLSVYWSPFLVNGTEKSPASGTMENRLYLDAADVRWSEKLPDMDVVVFSVGHWFLHPAIFYDAGEVIGCHHCPALNYTEIGFFGVFRKAMKTTLSEVAAADDKKKKKLAVVTTFSPAHFDGEWDKAGACARTEPYKEGEKEMEYMDKEMHKVELEEVAAAAATATATAGGLTIEALDVTKMAMLRPDGHPGPYMYPDPFAGAGAGEDRRVQNDCVHWCLPGPIDSWNEILLQIVLRWRRR